jgi:TetR/AcrR family transcriptional regulator, cholesterol catabolism regulator
VGQTPDEVPAAVPLAGPVRRARGDRTRAALVDAALELFDTKGVEATSIDEITSVAAVAKGTFYVHFQRKQDVLLEHAAQLVLTLQHDPTITAPTQHPEAALTALADRLAELVSTHPRALMGRAIREMVGNREQWVHVLGERPTLGQLILPIVERGRSAGTVRRDLSVHRVAHGLTILWLDAIIGWAEREAARDLRAELRDTLSLFLDGAVVR